MSHSSFSSSGDPDRDRREAIAIHKSNRRLSEGMCPNGCGKLFKGDSEGYTAFCPTCHYTNDRAKGAWSFLPVKPLSNTA